MRRSSLRPQSRGTLAGIAACLLTLALCVLLIHPVAEMGIYDDWSYIYSAQRLAATGHIHYIGWASAMLGVQLYPAALLLKLFHVSFTVARLATVGTALVTTGALYMVCALAGLRPRLAAFTTLAVMCSPLTLPLATTFMSDMTGLAATVLALLCVMLAVRASLPVPWLVAACVVSVLGGTARQTAWLGALVLMPSALLVLPRRRALLVAVALSWGVSLVCIVGCLHWYRLQPYAMPETVLTGRFTFGVLRHLLEAFARFFAELWLLLLPVGSLFLVLAWQRLGRRAPRVILAGVVVCLAVAVLLRGAWTPAMNLPGDVLGRHGELTMIPVFGQRPEQPSRTVRVLLLAVELLAGGAALVVLTGRRTAAPAARRTDLGVLIRLCLPFTLAYLALLCSRAGFVNLFDRYALPLLAVGAVIMARYAQEQTQALPLWLPAVVLVLFSGYGVATTHDAFALYRGVTQAVAQAARVGVAPEDIYAGWEQAGWLQTARRGHIPEDRPGAPRVRVRDTRACQLIAPDLYPEVQPHYALAFSPELCQGAVAGAQPLPVQFWLPRAVRQLFLVRNAPQ